MATSPNGPTQTLPSTLHRTALLDLLVATVVDLTGIERDELLTGRRTRQNHHEARAALWYVLREDHAWRLVDIAAPFDRDHSTIHHGIRTVDRRLSAADPDTAYLVTALRAAVVNAVGPVGATRATAEVRAVAEQALSATARLRLLVGTITETLEQLDAVARITLRDLETIEDDPVPTRNGGR